MKKLALFLSLLILLSMPLFVFAAEDRWEWIYTDSERSIFFDKQKIKKTSSENASLTFSVWLKSQYTEEGAKEFAKKLAPIKGFSYYVELVEIDNGLSRYRSLSAVYYDKKGKVLYSNNGYDWHVYPPGSIGELIIEKTTEYFKENYKN
jgi:beta-glucosidase/6-phospho-beta-glucosidase/beta-galactosidase